MAEPRLSERALDPQWEVAPRQVRAMLDAGDDVLLLDCREPQEHAVARVAEARLLPMGDIPSRLAELQEHADRKVVVMCHHGVRSMQVTAYLKQHGFEDVTSMAGGIDAWSREVDPGVKRY